MQLFSNNKSELDKHLTAMRKKKGGKCDISNWFKVNTIKYKVLSQVARDVLAMPISTIASKSALHYKGPYA